MTIIYTGDLIHDQSAVLDDDDINYNDGGGGDLQSLSSDFYSLLAGAGLITDAIDANNTYADKVGVGYSGDDWITVTGESTVNALRFAADSSGGALDGDIWTDSDSTDPMDYVRTADTGEIIYLYAVDGGSLLVGSTIAPDDAFWGGTLPTSFSDFDTDDTAGQDYGNVVITAFLDTAPDLLSAEVYYASFRPIMNPDTTLADNDTIDLGDNVWLFGDSSQVLTFSGLKPKKFLYGIAGEDSDDGSPATKIFVLGENYRVDSDEEPVNGPSAQELNTSSAGKFLLFPEIEDVATVGVHNQSVNPGQGIFVMLMNTAEDAGNYEDGDDAVALIDAADEDILLQSQMGFGIVQAVGNDGIEIEITGYDSGFTSGAQLIEDTAGPGPDQTLGTMGIKGIETVTVTWTNGDTDLGTGELIVYSDSVDLVGETPMLLDINGRIVTVTPKDLNGDDEPTKVVLGNVASQDLVTIDWTDDVDHALLHTNSGSIDWGIVAGSFGNPFSANIGVDMLHDDDGPTASVSAGTEPDVKYLFDGNFDHAGAATGNYEGNNGFALPTADEVTPDGPNTVTVNFAGAFTTNHDFGTDGGSGVITTYSFDGPTDGDAVMMGGSQATSGGITLEWKAITSGFAAVLSSDGTTQIFTVTKDGAANVTFAQSGPIDQPTANDADATPTPVFTADILTLDNGQISIKRSDSITDNDGDSNSDDASVDLGGNFGIGDDAPIVNVTADATDGEIAALGVNLDETIDPDDDQTADGADTYAESEEESISDTDPGPYVAPDGNGDLDDVIVGGVANTAVWKSDPGGFDNAGDDGVDQAIGRLESQDGQITALFGSAASSVDFGADGADGTYADGGFDHSLAFNLSGDGPVKTNLVATAVVDSPLDGVSEASRTVHLFQVSDTVIEGRVMGADGAFGGADDWVIIRMTLTDPDDPASATIVYENFAPVQNPDTTLKDETIALLIPESGDGTQETLSITYSVDARDFDQDVDADSASVELINADRTILEIDDDGPREGPFPNDVELFEDALTPNGRSDGPDPVEVVTESGSLATQVIAGSDGVKDFGWVPAGADATAFTDALDALGHSSGGEAVVWSLSYDESREIPDSDPPENADADVLYGKIFPSGSGPDGITILEVIVFPDGTYEMNLSGTFDHLAGLPGYEPSPTGTFDDDILLINFTDGLRASEGDDDPVEFRPNALRAEIEDDAPLAGFGAQGAEPGVQYLYDGNANAGNFQGNGNNAPPDADTVPTSDDPTGDPNSVMVDFSDVFTPDHAYGADGEGSTSSSYMLVLDDSIVAGSAVMMSGGAVTSGADAVTWKIVDASTIKAVTNAGDPDEADIFTLSVDGTGKVTFTQNGVLDHTDADSAALYTDDILTLDGGQVLLKRTDSITDADTDPSSASDTVDLGGNFGIGDDAPIADVNADGTEPGVQYLYDGNANSGNFEGSPDNAPPTTDVTPTADVAANGPNTVTVDYSGAYTTSHSAGADGQKSVTSVYTLVLGVANGDAVSMSGIDVESDGDSVVWDIVSDTEIHAVAAGSIIFKLEVVNTDDVKFTQMGVLDHQNPESMSVYTDDILTLDNGQVALRRTDTVTDNDDDTAANSADVDLGGNFGIGDDAPVITSAPDVPELDFVPNDMEVVDGSISPGADGLMDYIIKSATIGAIPVDSVLGVVTFDIATDGQKITYSFDRDGAGSEFDPVDFLEISLSDTNPGDYTAKILNGPPLVEVNLLAGSTFPGGPIEEFRPTGDGDFVLFDGFISNDWDASSDSLRDQFLPISDGGLGGDRGELGEESEGFSDEDINIDSNGIGLENAIMNPTEALAMFFDEDQAGIKITFDGATGGLKNFNIRIEAYLDGVFVDDAELPVTAPKGPNQEIVPWTSENGVFDELYLSLSIEGNDAIRIPEISTFSFADIADLSGTVTLELEDFDGDTDEETFNWSIDGSDDDVV